MIISIFNKIAAAIIKHYCKHVAAWLTMWPWFVLNQLIFSGREPGRGRCRCGADIENPPRAFAWTKTRVLEGRSVNTKKTTESYLRHLTCWKCGSYIYGKELITKNNH